MPQAVQILCHTIGRDNTEVPLEVAAVANSGLEHVFESRTVLWMNPVHKRCVGGRRCVWIQSENAKMLGRPGNLAGGNVPGPASGSADSLAFCQKSLAAAELLLRAPAFRIFTVQRHPGQMLFGHVHERTDVLDHLPGLVDGGMSDATMIAKAEVGQRKSPLDIEILLFPDRGIENLDEVGAIFRKNPLKGLLEGARVFNRIQAKNSVLLRRPIDILTARDVPGPASRVRQPLSFLKIGLDAAQFRLDPRAVSSGPDRYHPVGQVVGEFGEM